MNGKNAINEMEEVEVHVEDIIYMPDLEHPLDRPYPFAYFVSIQNHTGEPVKIMGRKWVVTQQNGDVMVVEGEGVVGEYPQLKEGEHFSYQSYHTVSEDSIAEGAFFGVTKSGKRFYTRIPRFHMHVPPEENDSKAEN